MNEPVGASNIRASLGRSGGPGHPRGSRLGPHLSALRGIGARPGQATSGCWRHQGSRPLLNGPRQPGAPARRPAPRRAHRHPRFLLGPQGHANLRSSPRPGIRRIGPPLRGGWVSALRSRVSPAAPSPPVDRWLVQRTDEHRSGGVGASAPTHGPQAAGGPPSPSPPGPAVHGRHQQSPPSIAVVVISRQPADAASVAPGAGAEEVDLQAAFCRRQAIDPE